VPDRRTVSLATLAWSFGVIALISRSHPFRESGSLATTDAPDDPLALATAVLRTSDRFTSAGVGYAGLTPNEVLAWRIIFFSPKRDDIFKQFLATASASGQLYALAGLRLSDSAAFARAAQLLRRAGRPQLKRDPLGSSTARAPDR
jgi:hypothetical protein